MRCRVKCISLNVEEGDKDGSVVHTVQFMPSGGDVNNEIWPSGKPIGSITFQKIEPQKFEVGKYYNVDIEEA